MYTLFEYATPSAGSAHVAGDVTSPQVESAATGSACTYAVTGTVMLASACASTAMTRSAVYGSVFSGRPSGDAYTGRSSCQSVERRPLSTSGRWIDAAAVSTVSQPGSSPTDHVGAADARSVPARNRVTLRLAGIALDCVLSRVMISVSCTTRACEPVVGDRQPSMYGMRLSSVLVATAHAADVGSSHEADSE